MAVDVSIPAITDTIIPIVTTDEEAEEEEEVVEPEMTGEEYIRTDSVVTYHFSCKLTDLNYKTGTESEVLDPSAVENEGGN